MKAKVALNSSYGLTVVDEKSRPLVQVLLSPLYANGLGSRVLAVVIKRLYAQPNLLAYKRITRCLLQAVGLHTVPS